MERISFTTRVLGNLAAERLMRQQVTQTLRSKNEAFTLTVNSGFLKAGETIEIFLDNLFIGFAQYITSTSTHWEALDGNDAQLGGFYNLDALKEALERAGFRYKPREEYQLFGHRFKWLGVPNAQKQK